MDGIVLELQTSIGEAYAVRASVGCGGWARVPWIAVAAPQQSTQHGLYLQLLFAADMSAAHLCLGQGTSKLKAALGQLAAGAHLAEVGRYVRRRCAELELLDVEPAGELLDGADYPPAPERAELAKERDGDLLQAEHELGCVALPAERLQVRMRMQMMRGCGYMRECEMKI